jgi:hypothetical protein
MSSPDFPWHGLDPAKSQFKKSQNSKISTENIWKSVSTVEKILTFKKSYTQHLEKSPSRSWFKPGGLDSKDQSKLRLSLVSRPTFLKCQDFLDSRDQLFFSRLRFLKLRLFNRDLAVWRFSSRLSRFSRFVFSKKNKFCSFASTKKQQIIFSLKRDNFFFRNISL